MKLRKFKTKAELKMYWMREFEVNVVKLKPETKGRIDWDTATFLFNSGHSAIVAALKYTRPDGAE